MARPRVRRKTKNINSKVSRKQRNPYNISFSGVHPLIQKSWDKTKTLSQNYEKLGLLSHLNGMAGGQGLKQNAHYNKLKNELSKASMEVEWRNPNEISQDVDVPVVDSEPEFEEMDKPKFIDPRVALIGSKVNLKRIRNVCIDRSPISEPSTVLLELEEESKHSIRHVRHASEHEERILDDLQNKHGLDFKKMARDLKLNKYQLTSGQLKKRFERLLLKRAGITAVSNE